MTQITGMKRDFVSKSFEKNRKKRATERLKKKLIELEINKHIITENLGAAYLEFNKTGTFQNFFSIKDIPELNNIEIYNLKSSALKTNVCFLPEFMFYTGLINNNYKEKIVYNNKEDKKESNNIFTYMFKKIFNLELCEVKTCEILNNLNKKTYLLHNILKDLRGLPKVAKFLSNKFNICEKIDDSFLVSDGFETKIIVEELNKDVVFKYTKTDFLSIQIIYEILLADKSIGCEEDFICTISMGDKNNNIIHYENLQNLFFNFSETKNYLSVKFVLENIHEVNTNFTLISSRKYMENINLDFKNIKNYENLQDLSEQNFSLLEKISNVNIKYLKDEK